MTSRHRSKEPELTFTDGQLGMWGQLPMDGSCTRASGVVLKDGGRENPPGEPLCRERKVVRDWKIYRPLVKTLEGEKMGRTGLRRAVN